MHHARQLDSMDIDAFMQAADGRKPSRNAEAAKADFLSRMQKDYPWRMRRINRDLKWLRRKAEQEAKQTGLGLDDARWWFR